MLSIWLSCMDSGYADHNSYIPVPVGGMQSEPKPRGLRWKLVGETEECLHTN